MRPVCLIGVRRVWSGAEGWPVRFLQPGVVWIRCLLMATPAVFLMLVRWRRRLLLLVLCLLWLCWGLLFLDGSALRGIGRIAGALLGRGSRLQVVWLWQMLLPSLLKWYLFPIQRRGIAMSGALSVALA